MADAGGAAERLLAEHGLKVVELAGRAAAHERAVFQGGNAGGIVAAILKAPERVEHQGGHGFSAEDSDYATHY